MLHLAPTGVILVASLAVGVVAAEEALTGDVVVAEVDEEVAVVDSMTEDVVDQEVAVALQLTVEASEISRARSRLFKSRGIA